MYRARSGDTWGNIAREVYGDDTFAELLRAANPGIPFPIPEGTPIQTPDPPAAASGLRGDQLEVLIGGERLGTLDDFAISYAIDAAAKGGFSVPNNADTRYLFTPLTNPTIKAGHFGQLLISGHCSSPSPSGGGESGTLGIDFFTRCALLEKANAPITSYPLEFRDLNLQQIAEHLIRPLGHSVQFIGDPGARFSRVDIEDETPVLSFLADLAAQRNLVISSTPAGDLLFQRETDTGSPVASISAGAPGIGIKVSFDEENHYSSVTGIMPAEAKKRAPARSFTVQNPWATVIRPHTYEVKDIDPGELETAVNTVAAQLFGSVFSVDLTVPTWIDAAGAVWQPNTTIKLKSPEDWIPGFFEFLIVEVTLNQTAGERSADLKLKIPGCYNGRIPESLPWPW